MIQQKNYIIKIFKIMMTNIMNYQRLKTQTRSKIQA